MGLIVLAIDGGSEKVALCEKLGDAVIDFMKTNLFTFSEQIMIPGLAWKHLTKSIYRT